MGFRLIVGAMALMGLAACGGARDDYPALMPTDQILAEPAMPAHAGDAARDDSLGAALDARGRALAGGGRIGSVGSDADLTRRADALRERAKTLSEQSIDQQPCAADAADCAPPSAPE